MENSRTKKRSCAAPKGARHAATLTRHTAQNANRVPSRPSLTDLRPPTITSTSAPALPSVSAHTALVPPHSPWHHTHSLSLHKQNKNASLVRSAHHTQHPTQPCTTRERAAAASSSPSSHTQQWQPAPGLQGTPLSSPSSFVLSGLFLQRPLVSPERPLTLFFFRQC